MSQPEPGFTVQVNLHLLIFLVCVECPSRRHVVPSEAPLGSVAVAPVDRPYRAGECVWICHAGSSQCLHGLHTVSDPVTVRGKMSALG